MTSSNARKNAKGLHIDQILRSERQHREGVTLVDDAFHASANRSQSMVDTQGAMTASSSHNDERAHTVSKCLPKDRASQAAAIVFEGTHAFNDYACNNILDCKRSSSTRIIGAASSSFYVTSEAKETTLDDANEPDCSFASAYSHRMDSLTATAYAPASSAHSAAIEHKESHGCSSDAFTASHMDAANKGSLSSVRAFGTLSYRHHQCPFSYTCKDETPILVHCEPYMASRNYANKPCLDSAVADADASLRLAEAAAIAAAEDNCPKPASPAAKDNCPKPVSPAAKDNSLLHTANAALSNAPALASTATALAAHRTAMAASSYFKSHDAMAASELFDASYALSASEYTKSCAAITSSADLSDELDKTVTLNEIAQREDIPAKAARNSGLVAVGGGCKAKPQLAFSNEFLARYHQTQPKTMPSEMLARIAQTKAKHSYFNSPLSDKHSAHDMDEEALLGGCESMDNSCGYADVAQCNQYSDVRNSQLHQIHVEAVQSAYAYASAMRKVNEMQDKLSKLHGKLQQNLIAERMLAQLKNKRIPHRSFVHSQDNHHTTHNEHRPQPCAAHYAEEHCL